MPDMAQMTPRLNWTYPHAALAAVPAKCAVSRLAEQMTAAPETPAAFICPDFSGRQRALSGAERGTAFHLFMQFADLRIAPDAIGQEIVRLTESGCLTPRQAAALQPERLRTFFDHPLRQRILAGADYQREVPFTLALPAREYPLPDGPLPAQDGDEFIVVQGIADALLTEPDGPVLIDFKTDRGLTAEQLRQRYAPQLQLYARALADICGRPIRQALLFSFSLGTTVEIPL